MTSLNLNQYPLVRVLLFFLPGIALGEYLPGYTLPAWALFTVTLGGLIVWFWLLRGRVAMGFHWVSGLLIALAYLLFGYCRVSASRGEELSAIPEAPHYLITVKEAPVRKGERVTLYGNVCFPNHQPLVGIRVVLKDAGEEVALLPGDRFLFSGRVVPLHFPVNPGGFDYNLFLRRKGIACLAYGEASSLVLLKPVKRYMIQRVATKVRLKLLERLAAHAPSDGLYAIAGALIIGYDDNLSPESRANFSRAGAMHILCVSGLHVGVMFLIINTLLRYLFRRKRMRWIRYLLLLLGLWSYAFVTGLSPSVMRATVMLSFVVTGKELERHTSIHNSIAASALFLLFLNPLLLFSIGFQLSYLAVISIVTFHKPLSGIFTPSCRIFRWGWDLLSVSLAAQLGIVPLTLYYFHSFPILFLLTNLVVIPLASLILYLGIAFLLLSSIPLLSQGVAFLFYLLIALLQRFTQWVSGIAWGVVDHINITGLHVVVIFFLLCALILLLYRGIYRRTRWVWLALTLLFGICGTHTALLRLQQRVVVYSHYRDLVVEYMVGREATLLHGEASHPGFASMLADAHRKYGIRARSPAMPPGYYGMSLSGKRRTAQFFMLGEMRMAICEGGWSAKEVADFPCVDVLILKGVRSIEALEVLCHKVTAHLVTVGISDYERVQQAFQGEGEHGSLVCTALEGALVLWAYHLPSGRVVTSIKTGRWSPKPPR
ncbi:MAG: hypothetical protein CSA95_04815 [Bacteroidetes bacterium]|nr:MAG: hypothetical protein CSA95_04815 [Bacteroidota bacterium]